MKYVQVCIVVMLLITVGSPAAVPQQGYAVRTEVYRVLYTGTSGREQKLIRPSEKIGTLQPLRVVTMPSDSDLQNLVRSASQIIRQYLIRDNPDPSKFKPALNVSAGDLLGGRTQIKKAVFYRMEGGGKEAREINVEVNINSLGSLDISKGYALKPLLAGYDCALVRIVFRNGRWTYNGSENTEIGCEDEAKSRVVNPSEETVDVEVVGSPRSTGNPDDFKKSIRSRVFGAIESYGDAQSFKIRRVREEIDGEHANAGLMQQRTISLERPRFLLRLVVE